MTELINRTVKPGEELPPPKITSYSEAIDSIETVQQFLESRGHVQESVIWFVDRYSCLFESFKNE